MQQPMKTVELVSLLTLAAALGAVVFENKA
jgi:hypothetical protein